MRRSERHLHSRRQWDPGDGLVGHAGRIPVAAGPFRYPRDSHRRDQGHLRRGRRLLRPQWLRRRGRRCRVDVQARRATRARAVDAPGRAWMGAARPRNGAHAARRPRYVWKRRFVESRGVFAAAQQSTGRRGQPARRPGNRARSSRPSDDTGQSGDAQRAGELQLPQHEAERESTCSPIRRTREPRSRHW